MKIRLRTTLAMIAALILVPFVVTTSQAWADGCSTLGNFQDVHRGDKFNDVADTMNQHGVETDEGGVPGFWTNTYFYNACGELTGFKITFMSPDGTPPWIVSSKHIVD